MLLKECIYTSHTFLTIQDFEPKQYYLAVLCNHYHCLVYEREN